MPEPSLESLYDTPNATRGIGQVHEVALEFLSKADQRYTSNRRIVVDLLATAEAPATISDLLEREADLAQSSLYRSLTVLEEAGIVHRIITSDDHARFELTEDVTGAHHHHLVCNGCGVVLDVTLPSELEVHLHEALSNVAAEASFTGRHHRVDLIGLCHDCTQSSV